VALESPPVPRSWILTGSPENHAATGARGFSVIGLKERHRNRAFEIEPGDRIVLYATGAVAFAGSIRIGGDLYHDWAPVWAWKPGQRDPYPWRFPTSPEVVLERPAWVPAESFADHLEHIRKWPRKHWTLAFQGQIRPVSDHDGRMLVQRLRAAAGAT
jgi:hypothetical protein